MDLGDECDDISAFYTAAPDSEEVCVLPVIYHRVMRERARARERGCVCVRVCVRA